MRLRPTITAVIPLFNKEKAVAQTISSVISQLRLPDELIIVDDGSTDNSVAIVRKALSSAGNLRWRLISQENAGVSAARNRGAAESRSQFIAFLDGDDEWLPDYTAELERLAMARPSASVLSIRSARLTGGGRIAPDRDGLPDDFFGIVENPLRVYRRGYGLLSSSSIALTKDAWDRSGGFPVGAQKGEDIYWWLKLCMTEVLAHSARALMIIHDEHSGIASRKGLVPHHFRYFLGSEDGRRHLDNADLVRFLGSNLVVQIGGHRLTGDTKVAAELKRLSKALPPTARLKCLAVSMVPFWCVRSAKWWRRGARGL